MDHVLTQQNPHWQQEPYKELTPRTCLNKLLEQLKLKEVQAITGIRRSGKSSLFRLLINHLLRQSPGTSILMLNMDDPTFSQAWEDPTHLDTLLLHAEKLTNNPIDYLFLDEIQSVKAAYDCERFKT